MILFWAFVFALSVFTIVFAGVWYYVSRYFGPMEDCHFCGQVYHYTTGVYNLDGFVITRRCPLCNGIESEIPIPDAHGYDEPDVSEVVE